MKKTRFDSLRSRAAIRLATGILLFVAAVLSPPQALRAADDSRPNIIVILCDDLGYGDLHCQGHPTIQTPNLDQLAADGIRFTDFYSAAPVCSSSRVGLLTGRTPNRAGVYDWIPEARQNPARWNQRSVVHMRKEEVTIPQLLKDAGYATCHSGKWHCNAYFNSPEQPQPGDAGFDHWFSTQNNASPSHENPVNFVRNGEEVGPLEGFSCQIVADEAIHWMEQHVGKKPEQPFFIYLCYHEPHEPIASPPDLVAKYENLGAANEDQAQFFANVENLDSATGKVLQKLDDLKLRDNTLVVFTSDNGPETLNRYPNAKRSYGSPGPLKGMKLHTHEAGYRVAGLMRWPARIAAGQVSSTPVSSLDFLPTFASLAGATVPEDLHLDGANFLPALEGKAVPRTQPLIWVYYNALNDAKVSMRDGDWKALGILNGGEFPKTDHVNEANIGMVRDAKIDQFEVYHISEDPSEEKNLTDEARPEVEAIKAKLPEIYRNVLDGSHVWPVVEKPE